jgi:serine/threonine protein kinase/Flp pilus assembly protein TadD
MRAKGKRVCKVCGTLIPEKSQACPVCVLRRALRPEEGSRRSSIDPNATELCFEHYQVLRKEDGTPMELGHGAMGVTYKAIDINLRCAVALKVIKAGFIGDESARRRFVREARSAASVRHPNVASVFHLGKSGDCYFYAMEYEEGETLENLIKRAGQLELKLALEIARQAAAGLAAVHKGKLVHRDIKPSNIMVSLDEGGCVTAKIIDLGLAKSLDEEGSQTAISMPGGFAGTPEFASPEQFAGVGVDIRSDLYSLGVVLWEMLTGRPPFRGTPAELIYQHQHGVLPLERLKGVPQRLTAILETLLDKDPKRRFQTPAELLKTVSKVTNELEKSTDQRHEVRTSLVQKVSCRRQRSGRTKPQECSVAVLPFESLSASKKDTYFADGVQDEILSNLAKVSQLKVISRTSVMKYRSCSDRDLLSIAAALGVGHVVEGTVRRQGSRVRVTSKLINAQTDEIVWSDCYDRDLTDIFAVQSEIAQTVASKMSARLSPGERKDIGGTPTSDLEAYDLYLQAKELISNSEFSFEYERSSFLKAIGLLESAIRKDSKFGLAYCLIAKAQDNLISVWRRSPEYISDFDRAKRRALGDAAVDEALRLHPALPEAHLAMAFHRYTCYRDYERSRVQIALAQCALPNSPEALLLAALLDQRQGRWQESVQALEKARSLDPRGTRTLDSLAWTYRSLRRYRDSNRIYSRLIELEPDKPFLKVRKAYTAFCEKADLSALRAAMDTLPSSVKNGLYMTSWRFGNAVRARDWIAARQTLSKNASDRLAFSFSDAVVPRRCGEIWLAAVQGKLHTIKPAFVAARDELKQQVEAHPDNASLLSALAIIDMTFGRKQEAIRNAQRAVEICPISEDAVQGQRLLDNLAIVWAWTDQPDSALSELSKSIRTPAGVTYGELKLNPAWDPLRKDPRFDNLLAQLAPRE